MTDTPQMIAPEMTFAELKENFGLFDEWDDRYRYIIDLGRKLPPFPQSLQVDETKVRGCMSQVWLVPGHAANDNTRFAFAADSDAHIVKGLIAVLGILFSGQRPEDVARIDPEEAFRVLGLDQHLSPSRRNGLVAMVQKIKQYAAAQVGKG
ncbi:MAG: SufE family protein [Rhodospirillaceae bacterium]|nr:SufE family protein [Rhodospirillaceae bacterium]